MFDCHRDILDYHNEQVTLSSKERSRMKDRRDANRNRVKRNLKEDDPKPIGFGSQGSYAMWTMVMDPDNDYDVDDGIYFEKSELVGARGAELTPRQIKQKVRDAANDGSFKTKPEVRTNCVRVYYNDGSHVDIPVYRKVVETDFWGDEEIRYEIAGGDWKTSDPKAVTDWFKDQNKELSPDTSNGRQFRRIVRLLKKFARSRQSWKSKNASGFVITKLASECFKASVDREDLALKNTMQAIYDRLQWDLQVRHPVIDEYLTSGADDTKTKFFREKLEWALSKLEVLDEQDCDRSAALEAWGQVFGSQFFFDRAAEERDKAAQSMASALKSVSHTEREARSAAAITRVTAAEVGYMPWTEPSKMAR